MDKRTFSLIARLEHIEELKEIGRNPYFRILMEKDIQELSYGDLCKKLSLEYGLTNYDYENLKKKLTGGKKIDQELVNALYKILHIETELDNQEAVCIYHYMKHRSARTGRPSKARQEEIQLLYNESQAKKHQPYNRDEMLLNDSDCEYTIIDYISDEQRLEEIEFLKRILLIYREIPQLFDELKGKFHFTEEDEEELEHLDIKLHQYYDTFQ